MEVVFLKLANLSLTASWMVLAVLCLRCLFKQAPRWLLCSLWGLVALRLICPFSIESALSLIPSGQPLPDEIIYTANPAIDSGISAIDNAINPILSQSMAPSEFVSANPTQIWSFIFSQIWILGMVIMLLYALMSYLLLRHRMAAATILRDNIKQSERVDTPFVLGFLRPTIYLPYSIDESDFAHVVAHEQAHIQRRDHWWKPLGFLLLSVYWFNPLLWLSYALLCHDIESACDEKVIREMDRENLRAYSTALLNCSIHRRSIAACPLAFGEGDVKKRVTRIMYYKKPTFWIVLTAVAASVVVAVCFLTNPKDTTQPQEGQEPETHMEMTNPGDAAKVIPLSPEEIEEVNKAFDPYVYDKNGRAIGAKTISCFFTSYYDDVRELDFEAFMRYFPGDGRTASRQEFEALRDVDGWPFSSVATLEQMVVPVHKYPAEVVNQVLDKYAGIQLEDLNPEYVAHVAYLSKYDSFYNYTSDAGSGRFFCTRGEKEGNVVRLYAETESCTVVLTLKMSDGSYRIVSHQHL